MLKTYNMPQVANNMQHLIYREVGIHARMQHQHVVHLYAAFKVRKQFFFVLLVGKAW